MNPITYVKQLPKSAKTALIIFVAAKLMVFELGYTATARPRGLVKKSAMVWAALVCVMVVAIWGLLCDDVGLKCASKYWD